MSLIKAQKVRIKMLKVKQSVFEAGIFIWAYCFIFAWIYTALDNPRPVTAVAYVAELALCYGLAVIELIICILADSIVIQYFNDRKQCEVKRLNEIIARHIRLGGTYTDWDD